MSDITTAQEHEERLNYLEKLLREQPESIEIEPLVNVIETYENIHYPLEGFNCNRVLASIKVQRICNL